MERHDSKQRSFGEHLPRHHLSHDTKQHPGPATSFIIMPNQPLPSLQPPEWLTQRWANTASESDPRIEASWYYGPCNALLSHYFPYQQRFLIEPPPKSREPYAKDADFSFSSTQEESSMVIMDEPSLAPDLSMTSIDGLARLGGSTVIPDFIVAKVIDSDFTHDKALLLVKIKVREPEIQSRLRSYEYQMDQYMNATAEQMPEGTKLVGLLICGTGVSIFRLEGPGSEIKIDEQRHDINSTAVRQLLLNIAEDHWHY